MDARAPLRGFARLSAWEGLPFAVPASALLAILSYLGLAQRAPGAALLIASVATFAALLGAVLWLWPAEEKITLERQAEVVGARLLVAIVAYFALGAAVLWGLNSLSPDEARVPLTWQGPMLQPWENPFFRRVTFWPFYALVLGGCQAGFPTPPGAC